jgi:bifunctional DNA-binding transcriptional regulator/antitoxin component of YhaV-PrlF toxin-antitoxin module
MLVHTDDRRRITIPAKAGIKPGDTVDLEILPDGRIMLIPMATVPKHQLWAWTPENQKKVRDSLRDPRPSTVLETEKDVKAVTKRWTDED